MIVFGEMGKHLILHIGMGKCGSTSLQTYFASLNHSDVEYVTYPGEIDFNPIIADYLAEEDLPDSVKYAMWRHPLDATFADYVCGRVGKADVDHIVLSAEHIAWMLDDKQSELLLCRLKESSESDRTIRVICYFRQPADARFVSLLQEDAKYNHTIRLFVSTYPYSLNAIVYKRWRRLCEQYGIEWIPVLFQSDALKHGDVIDDFVFRTGMQTIDGTGCRLQENTSVDPHVLCAVRSLLGEIYLRLPWSRLSVLVNDLLAEGAKIIEETPGFPRQEWVFKPPLAKYINLVSAEEEGLPFVNGTALQNSTAPGSLENWNPNLIHEQLPLGLKYEEGYVTGNLEAFLDHVDLEMVRYLVDALDAGGLEGSF